ncbi:MAG: 16S rRNA (cytidine(1402)-2'-O)-methyltransferase [bacterium]|nr:16S rRNA (cytidine(1402)-2'-O)-methyltransferase [bacterium]
MQSLKSGPGPSEPGDEQPSAPAQDQQRNPQNAADLRTRAQIPPGPALYIVATPIGNLEDVTLRALRILEQVDTILSEDTRKTGILLKHYGLSTRQKSYRVHNEDRDLETALSFLREGRNLAFCSDAGTPGISDPGSRLVRAMRDTMPDAPIFTIPGPSALVAALSISGWQAHPSVFGGFLSPKPGRRRKFLNARADSDDLIVLYESVHRIEGLLRDIRTIFPDRFIQVARELTKIYEEVVIFSPDFSDLQWEEALKALSRKGEFTVIIGPRRESF